MLGVAAPKRFGMALQFHHERPALEVVIVEEVEKQD